MRLQAKVDVKLVCSAAALVFLSISIGMLRAAEQPQKRHSALVMMGTNEAYHMEPEQIEAVAGLLTGYCKLAANFSDNPADFTFENARKYDVIILYSAFNRGIQGERPTKTALENVFRAVEAGTPLLAMHGGLYIAGREGSPELEEKLGCRYQAPTFPYQRFTVKIDKTHPITEGVEDFAVLDEPYRLEVIAPGADILASYDARLVSVAGLFGPNLPESQKRSITLTHQWAEKTARAPVLYTRVLGKGRIVTTLLGHDEGAWHNPSFRTLIEQSLNWLLEGR
jgi:uncharacterized protein